MSSKEEQSKTRTGSMLQGRGWLAVKFTLASMLGGGLLFGISTYRQHLVEEEIKNETIEAVFPSKNDPALRYQSLSSEGEARKWILRHNKSMQDSAKAAEFKKWLSQFDGLKDASHIQKIREINKAVNKDVTYTPEEYMYGRGEYYALPYWTLKGGVGDCDDYAILQYYALKYVGYTDRKCFVAAVATEGDGIDHAVAVVDTSDISEKTFRAENMVMLDNGGVLHSMKDTQYLPKVFYNRSGTYLVSYPGVMRSEGALK